MSESIDLKPVKKLTPHPVWMKNKDIERIFKALSKQSKDGATALFVGGCVRNALLGRASSDIDIATSLPPGQVIEKLTKSDITALPTGLDHGTVTAVIQGKNVEITTLRKDVETDGRRATVAFTKSWLEDAKRRDFTVNTLLADLEGNIYDPTGSGIQDLEKGIIRFVGDPEQRIREDVLRILRFFRFHSIYGTGQPDKHALDACRKLAGLIPELSKERITQEFSKILDSHNAAETLSIMSENNIMNELLSEYSAESLQKLIRLQSMLQGHDLVANLVARYLCVFNLKEEQFQSSQKLILFTNEQIKHKKNILRASAITNEQIKTQHSATKSDFLKHAKINVYKNGKAHCIQAYLLKVSAGDLDTDIVQSCVSDLQAWDIPEFPVNGKDLQKLGVTPGKNMGYILKQIENWWIENDFMPDKQSCLNYAEKHLLN